MRPLRCLIGSHDLRPLGQPSPQSRHWKCARCGKEYGQHLSYPECVLPWTGEFDAFYARRGYDAAGARHAFVPTRPAPGGSDER